MDKETEIKTLKSLEGDSYFGQYFSHEDVNQMCLNIKNDFPLEYNIDKLEASVERDRLEKSNEKNEKMYENAMEQVDKLTKDKDGIARYIADQARKLNSRELRTKAIELMEDETVYIKYCLTKNYALWEEDKHSLIKML